MTTGLVMRLQKCLRLPVRMEGGCRYGCYWVIEVLNHLEMIQSSVVFLFSSAEVGTNGYEFS